MDREHVLMDNKIPEQVKDLIVDTLAALDPVRTKILANIESSYRRGQNASPSVLTLAEIFTLSDHQAGLEYLYEKVLAKVDLVPNNIPFVEVGTRSGGSALLILHAIKKGAKTHPLITIDPYGGKLYRMGTETFSLNYDERHYRIAMKHISELLIQDDKLVHSHFKITSADFIKVYDQITLWCNGAPLREPFGFVYLDGEHEENTVAAELEFFMNRMHKDGMIVIDDSEHIIASTHSIITDFLKHATANGNRLYFDYHLIGRK